MGHCDESSSFYSTMETKCALTCGFCKAPEGLIPFSSIAKDCSSFRAVGDFWGHFQMKEGSTMDKGTLIFTIYDSNMWTKEQSNSAGCFESTEINALELTLRANDAVECRSPKIYRNGQDWTLVANDNTVTVNVGEPKAFTGKSPTVELSYDMSLDKLKIGMHIFSNTGGHSKQQSDAPISSFLPGSTYYTKVSDFKA